MWVRALKAHTHYTDLESADGNSRSANWIGVKILNMLDTGSRPTITKSVVESAYSELETADLTADSNTDSPKVGVWVRALSMGLL